MNYKEAVTKAQKEATKLGFETKRAEWLMMDLFDFTLTDYVMHMHDTMSVEDQTRYEQAVSRMLSGEPIQYITGYQTFAGEKFKVDERCLIPRPETEEVLMYFIDHIKDFGTVADIGTGSGILAIMLKLLRPKLDVYASDLLDGPLSIAQKNAENHQVDLTFIKGSDLDPFIEKGIQLDGLISNPPYIDFSEMDEMDKTVINYEPHSALFAENQGLAIYHAILSKLPKVMKEESLVVFEIGYQQGVALKEMVLQMYPNLEVNVIKDINQNDRILSFEWKSEA